MNRNLYSCFSIILISAYLSGCSYFLLEEQQIPQKEIIAAYQYSPVPLTNFSLTELSPGNYKIAFNSFDGALVNGQISYPNNNQTKHPVLVGVSPMGRNYNRWWLDSFKQRPTVSNVNKIASAALENGYAVVAIDARYHGSRKDPNRTLRSIMNDLQYFGDKTTYEEMIVNTVKDYRVLLDWLENQEMIDRDNLVMAGYSMGGQISLLTASVDHRIGKVVSIVPPFIDDTVALAAPKNLVSLLDNVEVLFITADDDEYATEEQNLLILKQIGSSKKEHIVFESDHILPANYVNSVKDWLVNKQK